MKVVDGCMCVPLWFWYIACSLAGYGAGTLLKGLLQ
jgi:hypothetical protein